MTENYIPVNTRISCPDGILCVVKSADIREFDENTYAKCRDVFFHNGVISVEVKSSLLPDAPDFARGFIGIAFRISEDDSSFECFYVRPLNGRNCTDPVRRSHGCQYFSYPGYTFAYLRDHGIAGFEAPADIAMDEWITLKAEVHGSRAVFYVNGLEVLRTDHLKHGDSEGGVGCFVDVGTKGMFRNLIVIPEEEQKGE